MPTLTETKVHRFYSRGREERLVRQPKVMQETPLGRQIMLQGSVAYSFGPDGRLELREGQDMLADGPPGPDGQPTMQDAVTWLTEGFQHPDGHFGPHSQLNVRVWHEGHEPDRPLPTEDDFLDDVTSALQMLTPEPLAKLLQTERDTHNRTMLVKAAEGALRKIHETIADGEAAEKAKK